MFSDYSQYENTLLSTEAQPQPTKTSSPYLSYNDEILIKTSYNGQAYNPKTFKLTARFKKYVKDGMP